MTWTVYFDTKTGDAKRTDYGAYIIEGDFLDTAMTFAEVTGLDLDTEDISICEFSHLEEAEMSCCTDRVLYLSK